MQARSGARLESRSITSNERIQYIYIPLKNNFEPLYTFHHVSVFITAVSASASLLAMARNVLAFEIIFALACHYAVSKLWQGIEVDVVRVPQRSVLCRHFRPRLAVA